MLDDGYGESWTFIQKNLVNHTMAASHIQDKIRKEQGKRLD